MAGLRLAALVACAFLLAAPGAAADGMVGSVTVEGDLALVGGERLRLVGLRYAMDGVERDGRTPTPAAFEAIARQALGRSVHARSGQYRRDRYGRLQGEAIIGELAEHGGSLQRSLVAAGLAVVDPGPDPPPSVATWLAAEAEARAARRGIWSAPSSMPVAADDAARRIGRFALVEGRVMAVGRSAEQTFLNFGPDRRTDFTAGIESADRRVFRASGIDIERLEGRRVRLRGVLRRWNGPFMDLEHPAQLELLDAQ